MVVQVKRKIVIPIPEWDEEMHQRVGVTDLPLGHD